MRRTLSLLLISLLAACGGGDDARDPGESMAVPGEPEVTPAESAAAAREVQRRADSIRDAVRRASGGEEADPPPAERPGRGGSVRERYEACMEQAAQGDPEVRGRLEQACANIRNQPG